MNSARLIITLGFVGAASAALAACTDSGPRAFHGDADGSLGSPGRGASAGGGASTGGANGAGSGTASDGGTGTGGMTTGACDPTSCAGRTVQGTALPGCCMATGGCGVVVAGQCIDATVLDTLPPEETIVPDPTCKGRTFDIDGGPVSFDGCCDKTGFCGLSTASFPPVLGIKLPTQCLTPEDLSRIPGPGGSPPPDAGPPVPCSYPDASGG